LYTDGISKYGHHYSTCDIGDSEGNVFVTGFRDISYFGGRGLMSLVT